MVQILLFQKGKKNPEIKNLKKTTNLLLKLTYYLQNISQ